MFEENESLGMGVGSLAATACTELFSAYGVELGPTDKRWAAGDVQFGSEHPQHPSSNEGDILLF